MTSAPAVSERVVGRLLPALSRLLGQGLSLTEISVGALAAEAGLARRTFYLHFDDKLSLVRYALPGVVADLHAGFERLSGLSHTAPPADVEAALRVMCAEYEPHRLYMQAVAEAATYDRRTSEFYENALSEIAERLEAYIVAGQRGLHFRPEIDPPVMAEWLTVLLSSGFAGICAADGTTRERGLRELARIYWRALRIRDVA